MIRHYLEFEKPLKELEARYEELKALSMDGREDFSSEIEKLEKKINKLKQEIFTNLTPWQKTLLARHIDRPHTLDFINMIFKNFVELHGDRNFRDDPAIIGGFASLDGKTVMVIGHQKGKDPKDMNAHNFGMSHPEGYRKALRLMSLAERFKKPIITMIDTPGAFPGVGAEERGQAEAIAKNLRVMSILKVPIIVIIIGEGGSGGALALGVGDRILMLENAIYSVISPEGCAAILWKDGSKGKLAAEALKLTASDLFELNIIDQIIKEPLGGAHRDPETTANNLKESILSHLNEITQLPTQLLIEKRYEKFRKMGVFTEG
ncbi:MAG: acetyl-CoA carboxylase carboxyl transferase subunit alpha [Deltaproteobacteria bacterium]|nr:MAG: acetyl-CoA carboxylase carboxyl transferase subunit alpha [Deltaproteobacteria bacterium]